MERTQIRIVAGSLRGRKLTVNVHEGMRPTPQMVREALFSILGNAVPGRPFFDVFAGTGAVGLEAISRGASRTTFVERDFSLGDAIEKYAREFHVANKGEVLRTDVYRWAERWLAPREPVNVFLSPPFPDLAKRPDEFIRLVAAVREKAAEFSVVVLQLEDGYPPPIVADPDNWDARKYGRNLLFFWVKGVDPSPGEEPSDGSDAEPVGGGGDE